MTREQANEKAQAYITLEKNGSHFILMFKGDTRAKAVGVSTQETAVIEHEWWVEWLTSIIFATQADALEERP